MFRMAKLAPWRLYVGEKFVVCVLKNCGFWYLIISYSPYIDTKQAELFLPSCRIHQGDCARGELHKYFSQNKDVIGRVN